MNKNKFIFIALKFMVGCFHHAKSTKHYVSTESNVYGQVADHLMHTAQLSQLDDKHIIDYTNARNKFSLLIKTFMVNENKIFSYMDDTGTLISQKCLQDLLYIPFHINEKWAQRMVDSMGKLGSGLTVGNTFLLGDYDECRNINGAVNGTNNTLTNILGRYCLATFGLGSGQTYSYGIIRWGVCVPSSCHDADILAILNSTLSSHPSINQNLPLESVRCSQSDDVLTVRAIVAIVILSIFAFFLTLGTLYDVIRPPFFWQSELKNQYNKQIINETTDSSISQTEETPLLHHQERVTVLPDSSDMQSKTTSVLIAFSLYNNTKKLFSTKMSSNTVAGINGFRVLSLAWVILGHVFTFVFPYIRNTLTAIETVPKDLSIQPLISSFYSVDSFFFMSGVLVTYNLLNIFHLDCTKLRSVKFWIVFYVHRFLRLTPIYMLVLMIYVCLSQYWSAGPFAIPADNPGVRICEKNWWANLLYINNFWNLADQCIGWSWYLSNDMQFYIISPLIIVPLFLKPVIAFFGISSLFLAQLIYRAVVSSNLHLMINEVVLTSNLTLLLEQLTRPEYQQWVYYYTAPYSRIAPYLMGIITGYSLYKYRLKPNNLPKWRVLLYWACSICIIFGLLYCTYNQSSGQVASNAVNSFVNAINKTLWGVACGWIIYATHVGHAGIAGEFLCWSGWAPLARLTYAAYLVHPLIIECNFANMRVPLYYETYTLVLHFYSNWVMSYFMAYIASMSFEAPVLGLEKLIFHR